MAGHPSSLHIIVVPTRLITVVGVSLAVIDFMMHVVVLFCDGMEVLCLFCAVSTTPLPPYQLHGCHASPYSPQYQVYAVNRMCRSTEKGRRKRGT